MTPPDADELFQGLYDLMNEHCLSPAELAVAATQFSIDYSIWVEESFLCMDCHIHTARIGQYYMLNDDVWSVVNPDIDGMLCWGCVERRLGRLLTPADFDETIPVNENIGSRLDKWHGC